MTFWKIVLINFIVAYANYGAVADDCEQFPAELSMNLEPCCAFPNMSDPVVEKKIQEVAKATPGSSDNFLLACKVAETVFTEMKIVKDNSMDKDAYSKMIDDKIPKDIEFWKKPLKDAFEQCHNSLLADVSKITEIFAKPPFNIKKEDCDAQYLTMFVCLHIDSFVNCPEKAWKATESDPNQKTCASVKTWFGKCGKNLGALKKIISGNKA